jgi:hypothetical protein
VQNKATKFAKQRNNLKWKTVAQSRKIAGICVLFKAYTGERAWKAVRDRLQKPYYLITVDEDRKIRSRKKKDMPENILCK